MANKVKLRDVQRIFYGSIGIFIALGVVVLAIIWHGVAPVAFVLSCILGVCALVWGPDLITRAWNARVDRMSRDGR